MNKRKKLSYKELQTRPCSAQEVEDFFNRRRDKVDILYEALDYMQSYNGRSKLECIALSLGLTLKED